MDISRLDEFTRAYIVCALWASTDDDGEPLDAQYDDTDLHPETVAKMVVDCQRFQVENSALLKAAYAPRWAEDSTGKEYRKEDYTAEQAGHDFWLTRNGHGAGFWDRGLEDVGKALSEACGWRTAYPECHLYIGDDNRIYQE